MQVLDIKLKQDKKEENIFFGLKVSYKEEYSLISPQPVVLQIVNSDRKFETYTTAYCSVYENGNLFECKALLTTKNGSEFLVLDQYAIDCKNNEIIMKRKVKVMKAESEDIGFSSEFAIGFSNADHRRWQERFEVFVPGIWYRHNKGVVKEAFGSDMFRENYYIRATRMALPYIQLYEPNKKTSVSICHTGSMPDTGIIENSSDLMIDERFQYPSLGITIEQTPVLKYNYPGSEGEINYIDHEDKWARRSHPVKQSIIHEYELRLHIEEATDSYESMRNEWRHWYAYFSPVYHRCDLEKVYQDGIALLNTYCQEYNSVMGLPFWTTVPDGNVSDISYQMGFVGQQTQCAYHLIRYGISNQHFGMVEKGKKIIWFWVKESAKESMLPQVWYDVFPARFRPGYPTYLRTVSDGMEGILNAYLYLKKSGEKIDEWLEFCLRYADKLFKLQASDGSFARAYGKDGEIIHNGKYNTSNIIRFLALLYHETGIEKYKQLAVSSGNFCYYYIYEQMAYIGGTADNDNTIDKEAGMQALYAFLALYDLTGDKKWIKAARGAADFCETWTYSWVFPVHPHKGNCVFHRADQTGLSLIATGHSHCDVMMAYCPYDYYRLYQLTEDYHYLDFANMILYNTKQTTDWEEIYGYSYPGLVEESGEIALQYHNGLGRWLPWCTIAEIEVLTRMEDELGEMKFPDK